MAPGISMTKQEQDSINIPLSKISIPRSRVWINRDRLFLKLDKLRKQSAVWITAPAGAGKTILAASYIQEKNIPYIWYNFDSGDSDPASFFYYLRLAFRSSLPESQSRLPLLTSDYQPGISLFADIFFHQFFHNHKKNFTLVLDNVQEIANNSDFITILKTATNKTPAGMNIICLSRSAPPASLSRMIINREISLLDWDDLRLTTGEVRELASKLSPGDIPDDTLTDLNKKSEGWAAGLVLLLGGIGGEKEIKKHSSSSSQHTIFNYFASEIIAGLNKKERLFLLTTAYPPTLTGQIAASLSGEDDAVKLLESMIERNFFTFKLQGHPTTYRYHPLFRDFLLNQAERHFSSAEIARIRLDAARLLLESNDRESAVPLLIEAHEWHAVTEVIGECAPELIPQGRHLLLLEWLSRIPDAVLDTTPWLIYWKAAALMPFDFSASHRLYSRCFDLFFKEADLPGSAMAWAGSVETVVHSLSHTERLDEWIDKFEELCTLADIDKNPELQSCIAPQMIAIYALRGKMDPQLEMWLTIAQSLLTYPIDPTQRIMASFALIAFFHWSGQPARSIPILKLQERIFAEGEVTPLATIITRLCVAWFSWIYGHFNQCTSAIEEGLEIIDRTGVQHWTYILVIQGITNALVRNDIDVAENYFKRLEPLHQYARDMDRAYYHNEAGWLEMLKGRPEEALHQQRMALEIAVSVGAPFVIAETSFGLSQACHSVGKEEDARKHLLEAVRLGELYGSQTLAFQCGLLETYYLLEDQDEERAADVLGKTLNQARRLGHVAFAWWRQDIMTRLCDFALEHKIETDFTDNLIRQYDLPPPATPSMNWPWPVKVYTMGTFKLEVAGNPVTFSGKVRKKPLELLQAIIALGSNDVNEQMVTDALWPDSDGDLALQTLRKTVSRLRKLMQNDKAVTYGNGKIGLSKRYVWIDVNFFKQASENLARAQFDAGTPLDKEAVTAWFAAVDFYHENFLPDMNWPFLLPTRENLRRKFLESILCLGRHFELKGLHEQALKYYQRGIEVDNLAEPIARRLINLYGEIGRNADAMRTYRQLRDNLASELGIEPSAKTSKIMKRYITETPG